MKRKTSLYHHHIIGRVAHSFDHSLEFVAVGVLVESIQRGVVPVLQRVWSIRQWLPDVVLKLLLDVQSKSLRQLLDFPVRVVPEVLQLMTANKQKGEGQNFKT